MVAFLRHGGNDKQFADRMEQHRNLVKGINHWAEANVLASEMRVSIQDILQSIRYPEESVVRVVAFKEPKKVWIGAFEFDSTRRGGAYRSVSDTPKFYEQTGAVQLERRDELDFCREVLDMYASRPPLPRRAKATGSDGRPGKKGERQIQRLGNLERHSGLGQRFLLGG
jgi:hypothetical protein